ncbi:MAG: BON domain-containing protein [Armatimonadota bacterium]|nr:BON domain-containing protein [Armatimonadota bacterium]
MKLSSMALIILSIYILTGAICAQPTPDTQIYEQILNRLKPHLKPHDEATVEVKNGVVTIVGKVADLQTKQKILNFSKRTLGVRQIVDQVSVVPLQKQTDEQILKEIISVLRSSLNKEEMAAISVQVKNGIVTLSGTLTNSYSKQTAGLASSFIAGVVDVRNNIIVRPKVIRTDAEILADVRDRFRKNVFVANQKIDISVEKGIVTLTGTVDSFAQVEQAEAIARFTPGVIDVQNLLFVR